MGQPPKMLEGIRIVDLTTVVFGPHATQMLADLGAEVLKIETPAGDVFRYVGGQPESRTIGACHLTINRGKKSIMLDLKKDEDKGELQTLLASADVFIHNIRGHAIERLGFGPDAVRALRPDIIYVHCVGFGSGGPYSDLQAYDDVIQAASGTATLLPRVDGDSRPRYIPSLIADKVAGHYGAQAVLAALVHKLRTGEGQFVEVPMFEAFTHFMLVEHFCEAAYDTRAEKYGYARQLDPFRQPFPTADGHISIVPYQDASIIQTFKLLGAPHLLGDERFANPLARFLNASQVYAEMAKFTPAKTTDEWVSIFKRHQIPAMPVRDLGDVHNDPHLKAVGFFRDREHPLAGSYVEMRPPIRYSAAPDPRPAPAPAIGQDNEEYGIAGHKAR